MYSSSALVTAFDERLIQLLEAQVAREKLRDPALDFNEIPSSARFFRVFDIMCRNKLAGAICGLNNYNKPIIELSTMDIYVDLASTVFPRLWRHLCSLRYISGDRHSYDKPNRTKKKRLVLVQLLLLRRMRNSKLLKWWSVIQSVGYYGWGVGRTALDAFSAWGVVSHSKTRTAALKILCNNLVKKHLRKRMMQRELAKKKGSVKEDNKISLQLGFNRYLHDDIWKMGEKHIKLDDLSNKRKRRVKWLDREKKLKDAVERLHWETDQQNEIKEERRTPDAPWSRLIEDLHPRFYY